MTIVTCLWHDFPEIEVNIMGSQVLLANGSGDAHPIESVTPLRKGHRAKCIERCQRGTLIKGKDYSVQGFFGKKVLICDDYYPVWMFEPAPPLYDSVTILTMGFSELRYGIQEKGRTIAAFSCHKARDEYLLQLRNKR